MMNNNLTRYNQDPENFEARIVTGDETWIYYWELDRGSIRQAPPLKK